MAKNLKRKWFPIYYNAPGGDAGRVNDYAAGYCSCRMNVARFFGIEDDIEGDKDWFRVIEGKKAIDTTIMDGGGTTTVIQSTEDADNEVASYLYYFKKIARGKSAVMTTGTLNANKRLKTVSFLFPKAIPNSVCSKALAFIIPADKIDRKGEIALLNISPTVKIGSSTYTIPLLANVGTIPGGTIAVATNTGNKPTATETLKASIAAQGKQ
jgi:hypothetical protein